MSDTELFEELLARLLTEQLIVSEQLFALSNEPLSPAIMARLVRVSGELRTLIETLQSAIRTLEHLRSEDR